MSNGVSELGYVGFGVSDLNAWKEFASEVLGLEIGPGVGPNSFTLRMDYWVQRILVTENGEDDIDFVGWRVPDEVAFKEMRDRLARADISFSIGTPQQVEERQVLGLIQLSDPSGLPIEIFYGPHVEPAIPFHSGRPMHGPFVTGNKGLGHFAMSTDKTAECEEFYRNILGMRGGVEFDRELPPHISDGRLRLNFMSCNERQHSIAFGNLGGSKRLSHFMTEVAKIEDVGLTRAIVKKREVPIFLDLGQHNNDRVFSFYFDTPSGWAWECGWNVAPASGQVEWGELPIWGHEHRPKQ